jgi:hypothetical protein
MNYTIPIRNDEPSENELYLGDYTNDCEALIEFTKYGIRVEFERGTDLSPMIPIFDLLSEFDGSRDDFIAILKRTGWVD